MRRNRFYKHRDSSGGHPSLVYSANNRKDEFKAVCFTSKAGPKRKQLKHSINPESADKSYVKNRPICKPHTDFYWEDELKGFYVRKDDKKLVNSIKKRK